MINEDIDPYGEEDWDDDNKKPSMEIYTSEKWLVEASKVLARDIDREIIKKLIEIGHGKIIGKRRIY